MGGTLVDTYPEVDRTLAAATWPTPTQSQLDEVARLRSESIAHAIDVLSSRHGIDHYVLSQAYADLKERWRTHPAPLMDGAREVMDAARAGGGLNLVATHRDRTSAEALLRALEVHVDDLVCAPDGYARKPDPQMNLVLLDRHGLRPAEVVAVGDRPIDVEAAQAAGIEGFLLSDEGEGPGIIRSLRDLLDHLG